MSKLAHGIDLNTRRALRRIGTRIKAGRLMRHDTQADFAARLGVDRSTVAAIESGRGNVGIQTYLAAALIIGKLDDVVDAYDYAHNDMDRDFIEEHLPKRIRRRKMR